MSLNSDDSSKSFIVEIWSRIFGLLGRLTLYDLILNYFPRMQSPDFDRKVGKYKIVEGWVLGHLIISILLTILSRSPRVLLWEKILFLFGCWRVYEVVIYQINVVFFGQYRAEKLGEPYIIRGFLRIVILLLHNFIEIIFWFAFFYRNSPNAFDNNLLNSFIYSINFSFYTMTTFGHSNIMPINKIGYVLTFTQSFIGLFMALIVVSRFIAFLPPPKSLEKKSCAPVETMSNIGAKRAELLKMRGIATVEDFSKTNVDVLKNILNLNTKLILQMKQDAASIMNNSRYKP